MTLSMADNDKKWKAENDARTLADAIAIQQDKKRMAEARKAARRMLKEKKDEAVGMAQVAGEIDWDSDDEMEAEYKRRKNA